MSLKKLITVNTNYTRSINLERDADSTELAQSYIPTSRSILTLSRIASSLDEKDTPRAFALIGPYGSGKSAFAVFLSHLLGPCDDVATKSSWQVLNKTSQNLSQEFSCHADRTQGYLPVLITGTPEPLANRFIVSLHQAAEMYWQNKHGPTHQIVNKLKQAVNEQITIKKIMSLVCELQEAVSRNGRGILIVFDELGKFLEYEARHYGVNDIYLLQELAEHAFKGNKANLLVTVLMHQGFDQYARSLGDNLRNEWSKVQGRYENIPFLESTEQTLRVVASAFNHDLEQDQKEAIKGKCFLIATVLEQQNALPGVISGKDATDLFAQCYPLHPVVSLVLPILCQKLAQNERTLFSYLGSNEPHGFRDSLTRLADLGDYVNLWEIYEYFILNQPAILSDPSTHRRWAEVVTAIERLGDAPQEEIQLVKIIGLLNIIGAHGGLKASKSIVELCLPDKKEIKLTLESLIQKSILQFRKYSDEYRVWQGSDFDLEAAVQDELNQLGRLNLPEALNDQKPLPPVVARRHTINTGTLRYFFPLFVDSTSFTKEPSKTNELRIIICLAEKQADIELFKEQAIHHFEELDVVAIFHNGEQLRGAVAEVLALHRVQMNRPELNSDPVSLREFKDRLFVAEHVQDQLIAAFFENPEKSSWYCHGTSLHVNNKRHLQKELSRILDEVYIAAPIIKNELINREKPSSQAITARNKLISALLNNADKEDLDIEKFPPEKAIYITLFKATGLHKFIGGCWQLAAPDPENDPYNLIPVWNQLYKFLEETEEGPKSFIELGEKLTSPPYGVKEGVLPILYITAFLYYQHELAFYENGSYTPYVTEQHIERFLKRPDFFTVQRFRISGMRTSLFQEYVEVLYKDRSKEQNLLSIARPLAEFIEELPEYTKNTKELSSGAQKVVKAFDISKSPGDLLFERLPEACGYPKIDPKVTDNKRLEGFSATLTNLLREIKYCYPTLLNDQKDQISLALLGKRDHEIKELRNLLLGRYNGLDQFTIDKDGLRAFIQNICNRSRTDETWLEALLMFLGKRPPQKWSDTNREGIDLKLTEYSRRLKDLQRLQFSYEDNATVKGKDFDVILLRTMRRGKSENDEVICVDADLKRYFAKTKESVLRALEELNGNKAKLALLAELVDDLFVSKKQDTKGINDKVLKSIGNE